MNIDIEASGPSVSEEVESRAQRLRSASSFFVHRGTLECFPVFPFKPFKLDVYFLSLYLIFFFILPLLNISDSYQFSSSPDRDRGRSKMEEEVKRQEKEKERVSFLLLQFSNFHLSSFLLFQIFISTLFLNKKCTSKHIFVFISL